MNKYRRFKYPYGGETPQEFADARRAYYENVSNAAYQQLVANSTPSNIKHIEPTIPGVKDYVERTGQEVKDYINRNYNNQPSSSKGKIIRNHDKLYDYYKDGDKLFYRKKGGKNWIDISDNDVAQKRINATIARNKKSYGIKKVASNEYTSEEMRAQGFVQNNKGYWVKPENLEDTKTYDAGTLNNVVVTGTKRNSSSTPKRVKGSTAYNTTPQTQEDRWRKGKPGYIITRGAQKAIDFVKSLANKERNDNSNGYISRSQYMAKYYRDRLNQK